MTSRQGIEYRLCKNEKSAECIVICTGAGVHIEHNIWLQDELAKRCSVLLYNRGGYGESKLDQPKRTLEAVNAELESLVDELGLDNMILLGPSLGGYYARYYNYLHPELVKGVINIDTRISNLYAKIEDKMSADDKEAVAQYFAPLQLDDQLVQSEIDEVFTMEFNQFRYHETPVLNFYNTGYGEGLEFLSELIVNVEKQEAEMDKNVKLVFSDVGHDIITHDTEFFFSEVDKFLADIR